MTLNATNYSISKSLFEKIANAFKSAVRFIHRRGGYKAEYLKEEEVKPLIEHTYEAFSEAVDFGVKDNVIPEAMKMYLKNNTFVFSGFKTHQQLERVSRLLHDDDGHVKPFNRFFKDVQSIDKKYNRTYLQAEYNFAVASAQSAGQWHEFSQYADRYYLQYRTAKDERVREEHAILDGITLPMDDPFWDEYYVPLGWNCRCQVVQVSKKRYEPSNSAEALARGRAATYKPNADGVNKAAIFRFNPGKEHIIFMDKHPYFKTNDAKKIRSILNPNDEYTRIWKSDKNNGAVYKTTKQNKAEKDKNIDLAKIIAEKTNSEIMMLGIIDEIGVKNPDTFNISRNIYQEYKIVTSDKPDRLGKNIQEAKDQSPYVVIRNTGKISLDDAITQAKSRIKRHLKIKEVIIVHNDDVYIFNRGDI